MQRTLITKRARAMRKAMTEPELMLWSRLRGHRQDRPRFRRQHPVGSIILDFYCSAARLAVEVDGSTHWDDDARAKDAARDGWLRGQGVEVMRIPAGKIYFDLDCVVDAILLRADGRMPAEVRRVRLSPSTPRSSLRSAGGPPPAASRGR